MSSSRYFVAFHFCLWSRADTNLNLPLAERMDDGSVGFLPVYETREEAEAANPGARVLEIAPVAKAEEQEK